MPSLQLSFISGLKFPADISAGLTSLNLLRDTSNPLLEGGFPTPPSSKVPTLPDKIHVHSSEAAQKGIEEALATIHQHRPSFTVQTLLILHEAVFRYLESPGGHFKTADNYLYDIQEDGKQALIHTPLPAKKIPESIDQLIDNYHLALHTEDPLLVIALTLLDFILIHPFYDGNGRMFRLLSVVLLYDAGFVCAHELHFDKVLQNSRGLGQEALSASFAGWKEGRHEVMPWIRYFVGALSYAHAYNAFCTKDGL
jgi:Fic family protein